MHIPSWSTEYHQYKQNNSPCSALKTSFNVLSNNVNKTEITLAPKILQTISDSQGVCIFTLSAAAQATLIHFDFDEPAKPGYRRLRRAAVSSLSDKSTCDELIDIPIYLHSL